MFDETWYEEFNSPVDLCSNYWFHLKFLLVPNLALVPMVCHTFR